jgi:hypothetical protein
VSYLDMFRLGYCDVFVHCAAIVDSNGFCDTAAEIPLFAIHRVPTASQGTGAVIVCNADMAMY